MGATGNKSVMGGASTMSSQTQNQAQAQPQPQIVPSAQQAVNANNQQFSDTDNGPFKDFYGGRQYYQSQTFSVDTEMAIADYLYDQPVGGTLYSPSQTMNYKMAHGTALTPQETFMRDSLMEGMHNLGYNMNLEHYGRVSYIDAFGKEAQRLGLTNSVIDSNNFGNMTETQLKKAFTGLTYSEDGFLSTSYNKFKNAPNGGRPFTDKAVKINIKAPANAQAMMPGNGPGGALGEIVLAPKQNYRITDVRFTGKQGRSGSSSYKQIEFDVEMY